MSTHQIIQAARSLGSSQPNIDKDSVFDMLGIEKEDLSKEQCREILRAFQSGAAKAGHNGVVARSARSFRDDGVYC